MREFGGGLPPTVPLWSLRLALAYYDSGLGLAAAHVTEQRGMRRIPLSCALPHLAADMQHF